MEGFCISNSATVIPYFWAIPNLVSLACTTCFTEEEEIVVKGFAVFIFTGALAADKIKVSPIFNSGCFGFKATNSSTLNPTSLDKLYQVSLGCTIRIVGEESVLTGVACLTATDLGTNNTSFSLIPVCESGFNR